MKNVSRNQGKLHGDSPFVFGPKVSRGVFDRKVDVPTNEEKLSVPRYLIWRIKKNQKHTHYNPKTVSDYSNWKHTACLHIHHIDSGLELGAWDHPPSKPKVAWTLWTLLCWSRTCLWRSSVSCMRWVRGCFSEGNWKACEPEGEDHIESLYIAPESVIWVNLQTNQRGLWCTSSDQFYRSFGCNPLSSVVPALKSEQCSDWPWARQSQWCLSLRMTDFGFQDWRHRCSWLVLDFLSETQYHHVKDECFWTFMNF